MGFDHNSLVWVCLTMLSPYAFSGNLKKLKELGGMLLEHGQRYSFPRSTTTGETMMAVCDYFSGRFAEAVSAFEAITASSKNPLITINSQIYHVGALLRSGGFQQGEELAKQVTAFNDNKGYLVQNSYILFWLALTTVQKGNITSGVKTMEGLAQASQAQGNNFGTAWMHHILGAV
ncbi:MAG: hypothetical protein L7F78_14235 [Syntrophales bacterium LBB04]|nr:hypothetical protein [Syntrophales bacterium LBB04]